MISFEAFRARILAALVVISLVCYGGARLASAQYSPAGAASSSSLTFTGDTTGTGTGTIALTTSKLVSAAGGTVTMGDGVHAVTLQAATHTGAGLGTTLAGDPGTSGASGPVNLSYAAPASGTTESMVNVLRGTTPIASIGGVAGGSLWGYEWLGSNYAGANATVSNYTLKNDNAGNVTIGGQVLSGTSQQIHFTVGNSSGNYVGGFSYGGLSMGTGNALAVGTAFGNNEIGWTDGTADTTGLASSSKVQSVSGVLTAIAPSSDVTQLDYKSAGSANTQARTYQRVAGVLHVTSSSATTIATVTLPSTTAGGVEYKVMCRSTTAETGGAIGDAWYVHGDVLGTNVGGTVTMLGTPVTLAAFGNATLNSIAVTGVASGATVLINVAGPSTGGVQDCEAWVEGSVD